MVHEAAHLARWDDYGLLAQRFIEALFPWHPVVRWITRQMDLEREVACDDFVVEATGQARQYASCLTPNGGALRRPEHLVDGRCRNE